MSVEGGVPPHPTPLGQRDLAWPALLCIQRPKLLSSEHLECVCGSVQRSHLGGPSGALTAGSRAPPPGWDLLEVAIGLGRGGGVLCNFVVDMLIANEHVDEHQMPSPLLGLGPGHLVLRRCPKES